MRPTVIVEASTNHGGNRDHMVRMIADAAQAGADTIKWQSFRTKHLDPADPQFAWLQRCELSEADHEFLIRECKRAKIGFLTTVFHEDEVPFLAGLGLKAIKIGSGEAMREPLIEAVAQYPWSVTVSCGLATDHEIARTMGMLEDRSVTLLHCSSVYPTLLQDAGLGWIQDLEGHCPWRVGYSDHTVGIIAPLMAMEYYAEVVEVHMVGPARQQPWDKTPAQVAELVAWAKHRDKALTMPTRIDPATRPYVGRWTYVGT